MFFIPEYARRQTPFAKVIIVGPDDHYDLKPNDIVQIKTQQGGYAFKDMQVAFDLNPGIDIQLDTEHQSFDYWLLNEEDVLCKVDLEV